MAQRVKAVAAESEYMSSVLRSHMVEGEDRLPQVVFWTSYTYKGMFTKYGMQYHPRKINVK